MNLDTNPPYIVIEYRFVDRHTTMTEGIMALWTILGGRQVRRLEVQLEAYNNLCLRIA
jgi:hypothetical protein